MKLQRTLWFCALASTAACSPSRPAMPDASGDSAASDATSDDAEAVDVLVDTGVPAPEARPPIGPVRGARGNGFQAFLGIP